MTRRHPLSGMVACALGTVIAAPVFAGAFTFTSEANPQIVTHPANVQFNNSNPAPSVTVCLDPGAQPLTGNPVQSIRNAIATYNRLAAVQGNVDDAAGAGVPASRPDFESVFLHELGHCIGMDHSALGPSEVGCSLGGGGTCASHPTVFATMSDDGGNNTWNLTPGADGMRGSRDDNRGDDVNLHWYRRGVNNPFEMPPTVVDRTTYAVTTNYLPGTHTAVETSTSHSPCGNPTANTASLPGRVASTQNAMFPVLCLNNVIRELAPDDVTTLRIARAGGDGTQGTGDDYVPTLNYVGLTTNCDVRVRFSGGGFGVCEASATTHANNNYRLGQNTITLGQTNAINWFFNQTDTTVVDTADLALSLTATPVPAPLGQELAYNVAVRNNGPNTATQLQMVQTLPPGTELENAGGAGWTCDAGAATVTCIRASLDSGANSSITVRITVPLDYDGAPTLSSQASVSTAVQDPNTGNNGASVVVPVDFVLDRIFASSFE